MDDDDFGNMQGAGMDDDDFEDSDDEGEPL